MRKLTDHIVEGDSVNHQLDIEVTDEPGAGGANHAYQIRGFRLDTNPSDDRTGHHYNGFVLFQNGPIKEVGINGVTQEALLTIVIDRLRSLQAGSYACEANAAALKNCLQALDHLQARTRERIARGVEGTHQK